MHLLLVHKTHSYLTTAGLAFRVLLEFYSSIPHISFIDLPHSILWYCKVF